MKKNETELKIFNSTKNIIDAVSVKSLTEDFQNLKKQLQPIIFDKSLKILHESQEISKSIFKKNNINNVRNLFKQLINNSETNLISLFENKFQNFNTNKNVICPNCNGKILFGKNIDLDKLDDDFICENHYNDQICFGLAGNKDYMRFGLEKMVVLVLHFDKNIIELFVNNESICKINQINRDK